MTLFTLERGKLDAVAKGVRRLRSHLAGRLELATECALQMHRGRSLEIIVSAEIISAPWPALVEPERYAVLSLVAETIDAFCEPDEPLPDIYALLSGAIGAIAASKSPRGLLPRFELRLLEMLGLAPPLDRCVHCGNELMGDGFWLDAEAGGILDDACRERWRDLPAIDRRDLENLRALAVPRGAGTATLQATAAAAAAADELLAHHLGRRPKAVAYLGSLGA